MEGQGCRFHVALFFLFFNNSILGCKVGYVLYCTLGTEQREAVQYSTVRTQYSVRSTEYSTLDFLFGVLVTTR